MYIVILRNSFPTAKYPVDSYVGKNGIVENVDDAVRFTKEVAEVVKNLVKCTCHDSHCYAHETIVKKAE